MGSILDLEFITNRNFNSLSRELVTLVALIFRILIWNFGHVNSSLSRELVTLVALIFRILIWNLGHVNICFLKSALKSEAEGTWL